MPAESRRLLVTMRCETCGADLDQPVAHLIVNSRTGAATCGPCFVQTPFAFRLLADAAEKNAKRGVEAVRRRLGIDQPRSRFTKS